MDAVSQRAIVHSLFLVPLLATTAAAEVQIVLKDEFIRKYMNRATIDTCMFVDKVGRANFVDGDMHIAGRSHDVQLPVVAEIMNAGPLRDVRRRLKEVERGPCVRIAGAWRLWCEHGRNDVFVQGAPVAPARVDNPNHVFEIHPVSRVGDQFLAQTFRPISRLAARDAGVAFYAYESTPCRIRHSSTEQMTAIYSQIVWRNYTQFVMQILEEPPLIVEDGRFVYASVLDLDGDVLIHRRRMVFLKNTPPELLIRQRGPGDRVHVLGMPRISLALVDWRVQISAQRPEVLDGGLPYELVIVAVYPE